MSGASTGNGYGFHAFALKCFVEISRVQHIIVSDKNSGGAVI